MAQIRRRGPNIYTIVVYLGRHENGRKNCYNETFYGSPEQAKLRGAELDVKFKRQRNGPKSASMKLGEYLNDWLKKIKDSISDRTFGTYNWHVSRLILVVGDLPMYNLRTVDLQTHMVFSGLSPRTIRGIYGTLKTALRQAVAWGILGNDPTVGLRTKRVPRKEKKVLNINELETLLEAAKPYKYYLVLRILAYTGMRLGEVLGLKWQDIDFQRETLTVKRAADGRSRNLKQTKNTSSERIIRLDRETLNLLSKKKKVAKIDSLIFSHNGRVVREDAIRRTMNYAAKKAGLEHVSPHNLRHTAGSLLLDAGQSLPAVAAFLGHSSPATTAAVYAHAIKKNNRSIADLLEVGKLGGLKIQNNN